MDYSLSRREFLRKSSLAAALTGAGTFSQSRLWAEEKKEPLFKISLAQWSLVRRFRGQEGPQLDNLDFAKTARSFGIEGLEYVNQFFADKAKDTAYLKEMMKRADGEGVKSLLIMIDREGNLGDPDEAKRTEAVENHFKWIDAAKFLGCHSIRVNARSGWNLSYEEQMKLAADGLSRVSEYGAKNEINVLVENHGGLSSNGQWLVDVMKAVNNPYCGTLPDFGNFYTDKKKTVWYDSYKGVAELMPYAKSVSAKSYDFDPKRPWTTFSTKRKSEVDFLKMMRVVLDAGYRGWVGIESEGPKDQFEGVRKTKDLLERVHAKLLPEYS